MPNPDDADNLVALPGPLKAGLHPLSGISTNREHTFFTSGPAGSQVTVKFWDQVAGEYRDLDISPSVRETFYPPGQLAVEVVTALPDDEVFVVICAVNNAH